MNVYIYDPVADETYEIPYQTYTIKEEVNLGKTLQIKLDYYQVNDIAERYQTTAYSLLSGALREIYVEKDDTRIFSGVITDMSMDRGEGTDVTVSLAAAGYFNMLKKRRTAALRAFTSTDAGDIAWTLIDESQTADPPYSDFGITQGTSPTTKTRDRTFRFANLYDEIVQMTNNNLKDGFDCEIDDEKVFNIYYPYKGSNRPEIVLDIGNIQAISMRKPLLLNMTNKIYVLGQDDSTYVTRTAPDTFKTSFGVLEDVLAKREVKETTTLNDYGDQKLSTDQSPQLTMTIEHLDGEPDVLDYSVGDWLPVTFDEAGLTQVYYRVITRTIKDTAGGATTVSLGMRLQ